MNSFNEEIKKEVLYKELKESTRDGETGFILKLIKNQNLFDFEKIYELLDDDKANYHRYAVQISNYNKTSYMKDDIEQYKYLITLIKTKIISIGEVIEKKQILSSKVSNVWNCKCGGRNNDINDYCSKCKLDIFGFSRNDISLEITINSLEKKIRNLEILLN